MENLSTRVTDILNGVRCHNVRVGHPKCKVNKTYPWSHLIAMSLFCPPVPWGHHQASHKTMSIFQSDNKGKNISATCSTDRISHKRKKEEQEPAVLAGNLVSRDKRITPRRSINDSQCESMKAINREFWRETSEIWMTCLSVPWVPNTQRCIHYNHLKVVEQQSTLCSVNVLSAASGFLDILMSPKLWSEISGWGRNCWHDTVLCHTPFPHTSPR